MPVRTRDNPKFAGEAQVYITELLLFLSCEYNLSVFLFFDLRFDTFGTLFCLYFTVSIHNPFDKLTLPQSLFAGAASLRFTCHQCKGETIRWIFFQLMWDLRILMMLHRRMNDYKNSRKTSCGEHSCIRMRWTLFNSQTFLFHTMFLFFPPNFVGICFFWTCSCTWILFPLPPCHFSSMLDFIFIMQGSFPWIGGEIDREVIKVQVLLKS